MANAYFVSIYRRINDPAKLAAYAKLATHAIEAAGGRFLARGLPEKVYESGERERIVIIEFDSVAQIVAMHDGPDYQAALAALGDGAVRDIRVVPGV
jgi:uncharacterized protein (DUF1330 family)